MADNAPLPEDKPQPSALPPKRAGLTGKVMVLLSSVAKAPPVRTSQTISPAAGTPKALRPSLNMMGSPSAPSNKQPVPATKLARPGGRAEIKFTDRAPAVVPVEPPPEEYEETVILPVLSPMPVESPDPAPASAKAPPLEKSDSKKTSTRLFIPPIKLNQPVPEAVKEETTRDSILLGPGETEQEHPTRIHPPKAVDKPTAPTLAPSLPPANPFVVLPPIGSVAENSTRLQPPVVLSEPAVVAQVRTAVRPPPLPAPKLVENPTQGGIHVVPKMVGSEPVAHTEKLRPPPQLPHENVPTEALASSSESKAILRAPSLVPTESTPSGTRPPALPAKTTSKTDAKVTGPITRKEGINAKPEEAKPALRPAVLPKKSLINLKEIEPIEAPAKVESVEKTSDAPPPLNPTQSSEAGKLHAPVELPAKPAGQPSVLPAEKPALPLTRAQRAKKRRLWEMVVFYIVLLCVGAALYFGTIHFTQETRMEGQVIPPAGMPLADEVWIVSDFRPLTAGIAEDLAEERAPQMREIHEAEDHVQRVQADVAMREERIRLLQAQIQSAKDDEASIVKQARDDAQNLWDGPGAELDDDYNARQIALQNAISNRAKSLNLKYAPDPTYNAPEVWANAYRLALYEVPKGVDSAKEYDWLNAQMKQWRDFVKGQDDKREQLREQAAQIKMGPAAKLADLNAKIDELQHRIESTQSEEDPLKPELQQADSDLADAQTTETGLDAKYYKQLSALPASSITKRLQVETDGRFTWGNLENDSPFADGENEHHYWIFARATRADGREYWALGRFSISKNSTVGLLIEPESFISTKAMLRPDLSPDEQSQ